MVGDRQWRYSSSPHPGEHRGRICHVWPNLDIVFISRSETAAGKLTMHSKFDFRIIYLTRIMELQFALGEDVGWSADKAG